MYIYLFIIVKRKKTRTRVSNNLEPSRLYFCYLEHNKKKKPEFMSSFSSSSSLKEEKKHGDDSLPWIEKYRPCQLKDLISNMDVLETSIVFV